MARKRRSGQSAPRVCLIAWNAEYPPHAVTARDYYRWLRQGSTRQVSESPRVAVVCRGWVFRFHEDAGAVVVPASIGVAIPSNWRAIERAALYAVDGPVLTQDQIRLWIWQEYR